MSTHPYIPLYVDDYDAATAHLTVEEDGAYSRLIRLCWRTPGCSLPNDEAWIARKIRLSAEDFARVAKPVLEEFFTLSRGRLTQKRLKTEYENISRKKTARKLAGKKGGETKSRNAKDNSASNATDLPADTRAFQTHTQNHIQKEEPPTPLEGGQPDLLGEQPADDPPSRRKPKRPIPSGFPTLDLIQAQQQAARSAGADVDIAYQAERFRNWAEGADHRYADWPKTWANWCLRTIREAPKRSVPASAPVELSPADEREAWRRRVDRFLHGSGWWRDDEWGPRPGRPDCTVPADILREFGYGADVLPFEGRAA